MVFSGGFLWISLVFLCFLMVFYGFHWFSRVFRGL